MATDERSLLEKLERLQAWIILPFVPPLLYLIALAMHLSWPEVRSSLLPLLAPDVLIVGFILPSLYRRRLIARTFREDAGDAPDDRLYRLLELPRHIDFISTVTFTVGGSIYCFGACAIFQKPMWMGLLSSAMVSLSSLLTQLTSFVIVERWMRPFVLQEFHRQAGRIRPRKGSLLRVRQSWYLPYAFGVVIVFALTAATIIAWYHGHRAFADLAADAPNLTSEAVFAREHALLVEMGLPALGVLLYVLVLAVLAARLIASRQQQGAAALEKTLHALARGESALPEWLGTDELGDLSLGMASVHEKLRTFSRSLHQSALQLAGSAQQLEGASGRQSMLLVRQTAAVQETHVTVTEIQQTSSLAAEKATEVLRLAAQTDAVRQAGGAALEEGLSGLNVIKSQVESISERIAGLDAKAQQIVTITETVKSLAAQSNILALNAAIEAARAGESGKGFGVVAREMRRLADESMRETRRVRDVLDEVSESVRSVAEASEEGRRRIELSLGQVRSTGDAFQSLAEVVDANTTVARQIAAAVSQQSAGVSQVFLAVEDLNRMMSETMDQLRENDTAIAGLKGISADVNASTLRERDRAA